MIRRFYYTTEGNFDVCRMTGAKQLGRTETFCDYPDVKQNGMPRMNFIDIIEQLQYEEFENFVNPDEFPEFNIWSVKNMAKRYGETVSNFKRIALDPTCPAPVIIDGPVWFSHLASLDCWYEDADRMRRIRIIKRIKNLPTLGVTSSSGGAI
ncbi:MAG: hypothetical protein A2W05_01050 [Candidatus Schekmanbacteria bacterium RBG_16_38_10]|uniref:Uncharacterized protein n=1 Tax=Candidatus Schekmanbacteria bacterium RBG_16_38_10 TaxID=1817879 RepID=A0A1F7S2Q8_9BACT|nr:MAG: hypothetical protein A2W05_01050 [Candidatus Schekmanbacteria bacterium RBG_16_38_10]